MSCTLKVVSPDNVSDGSYQPLPTSTEVPPGYVPPPDTNGPDSWEKPVWSPDGDRLAFICQTGICIINKDGSHFQRLEPNETNVIAWSPDGQYLAYGKQALYLYRFQTQTETLVFKPSQLGGMGVIGWIPPHVARWLLNPSTAIVTPSSTPSLLLRLVQLCADKPNLIDNWQIINPNHQDVAYSFEIYDKQTNVVQKTITGIVKSVDSQTQGVMPVIAFIQPGTNTARLYVNGVLQDQKDAADLTCPTPMIPNRSIPSPLPTG